MSWCDIQGVEGNSVYERGSAKEFWSCSLKGVVLGVSA